MSVLFALHDVVDRLRQTAEQVDQSTEPPSAQLALLAEIGYFAHASQTNAAERRRLLDLLSSGCGATAFLASQHDGACRRLLTASHPLYAAASQGLEWVGVCFAHLRRRPSPVTVSQGPSGLCFDGWGPWFSGHGLMTKALVAGATEDGEFLTALCSLDSPGVHTAGAPSLAVMNATATVPLSFDKVVVPHEELVARSNAQLMNQADMHSTVHQCARSLGVARAASHFLPKTAREAVLARLESQHDKMDAWERDPNWQGATELRRQALELAGHAVQAALVCVGGRAHALNHPVQRLAREASFYATTQLTGELRDRLLEQL